MSGHSGSLPKTSLDKATDKAYVGRSQTGDPDPSTRENEPHRPA